MLVVDQIDLGVQVEKVEICAFYSLFLLFFHFEKVALHEIDVVVPFYWSAHDTSFLLFVTAKLLFNLHFYLLEYFELSLVRRWLLTPLASHIDVVAYRFI